MGAAVLLGGLRRGLQARVGLAIVLVGVGRRGLQRPDRGSGRPRLHPCPLRRRLARGVRPARPGRAERGRGGAGAAGRAGAGVGGPGGGGRGAGPDGARAPRRRRPRGERDGPPGRGGAAPDAGGVRGGGGAAGTSSRRAVRRSPRCAGCSVRCGRATTCSSSRRVPGWTTCRPWRGTSAPRGSTYDSTWTASRSPFRAPLDLSAYRIVQEGLTNALKHSGGRRADVTVEYASGQLRLEVRDDGPGGFAQSDGLGHGLIGIGERVKAYGGDMSAFVATSGGFVLRASLPLESSRAQTHDDPGPGGGRPGDGAGGLPPAARRRARHRGRGRGRQRSRGRRRGRSLSARTSS